MDILLRIPRPSSHSNCFKKYFKKKILPSEIENQKYFFLLIFIGWSPVVSIHEFIGAVHLCNGADVTTCTADSLVSRHRFLLFQIQGFF